MSVGLLDVNVLVALLDPAHPNHNGAHQWFSLNERGGWATSTITINGCVRVLSNPAYPTVDARPEEIVSRLREACAGPNHQFWSDESNLLDPHMFRPELLGGHQKITDASLLALACMKRGRLVTFDRSVPVRAVAGASSENLEVIGGV
jgi:uncharacterized protein